MLTNKELQIMRSNAKVHAKVFEKIQKIAKAGTKAKEIDDLAVKMCADAGVVSAFT